MMLKMPDVICMVTEISRLRQERDDLRRALLDAIVVFEIDTSTQFRKSYAALIERALREAP